VIERPVEHRRDAGVVRYQDDAVEVESLDHGVQILFLAGEGV